MAIRDLGVLAAFLFAIPTARIVQMGYWDLWPFVAIFAAGALVWLVTPR